MLLAAVSVLCCFSVVIIGDAVQCDRYCPREEENCAGVLAHPPFLSVSQALIVFGVVAMHKRLTHIALLAGMSKMIISSING